MSLVHLIFWIIRLPLRLLFWLLGLAWWIISTAFWLVSLVFPLIGWAWGVIIYFWRVAVILVNIAYMLLLYGMAANQHFSNFIDFLYLGLFSLALPFVVNLFIAESHFTFNLFLPIYFTLFVDLIGNNPKPHFTFGRNLVFFTFVCALL